MVQSYKTPLSKSSPAEQIKASVSHYNGLREAGSPGLSQARPHLSPRRKPPPTLLSVSQPDIRPRAVSAHSIGASFVTNNSKANTGRRKGSDQWQTLVGIPQICPVGHSCTDPPLRPPSPASSASSYQTALTTIQDSTPYLDARELPLTEDIPTLEPSIAQFTWNESAPNRPSKPSSRSRSRSPHSRAPPSTGIESTPKEPRLQSKPSQILLDYRATPTPSSNGAPPFPCAEETQTTLLAWQNEREMEDRVSFARTHHPTAVEDLYIFGSPKNKTAIEESFRVFPKLESVFCHATLVDESIIRTFQRRHWELISLEGCTTHFDAQLINGRITAKALAFTHKWAETDNPKPWLGVVNWEDVRTLRLEPLHVCRVFLSNLSFGKRLTFVRQLSISFPPGMYIEWCGLMSCLTRVQDLRILPNATNDLPIIPSSFLPALQSFHGPISAVKHYAAAKHLKRLNLYGNEADGGCDVAEIREAIQLSAEEWRNLEHLELRVHRPTEELYQDIRSTFKHLNTLVITVTDGPHPQILDGNQVLPSIESLRVGASVCHVELHHQVWLQAEREQFHKACISAIDRMQDLGQLATAVFTSRSLFSLLDQTPEMAAVLEPQNLRWEATE
ncbi:hypothetical protein PLEOSDRAFT_160872 [Pleurotus ostreatus PC15]|uniref:Uncharacterized protein n=1 Tax=Pleurotus ostreatus (strain PC15) TaxID=1137138 RepID=A0A067NB78_PLEO1|nr:hypothetical protein PLEOSDRAFT_160872 [Pleurotus ostreatus PC15]